MDVLQLLGDTGRVLLRVLIVSAPLLAWQFVAIWARPYRRRAGGLADPTIIAGMMVGFAILAVIMPLQVLTWDAIVDVGGFWDLETTQFADLARSMVLHGPGALLDALVTDDARRDLRAWLALAMTLWLLRVIAVWLSGPPESAVRLLVGEVATFVASVLGTVYLGPLLLWSINKLNFWTALIAVLLIQDYRYDEPPIFGRLVGAVSGFRPSRHHHPAPPPDGIPLAEDME